MSDSQSVALYWDFENLHAALADAQYGGGAYAENRNKPQPPLADVRAVVDYANSFGPLAINRAYANWLQFGRYRNDLLISAVELIQMFPPGAKGKNGADIRLCLDAAEDMMKFPHIGTIIVVGGDSDFMPLSYKIKAAGRILVGIGERGSTNRHWARSCHTFKYYDTLVAAATPAADAVPAPNPTEPVTTGPGDSAAATPEPTNVAALLARAMALVTPETEGGWVRGSALGALMKRLDPTFDPPALGYRNLSALLEDHGHVVDCQRDGSHVLCRLRSADVATNPAEATEPQAEAGELLVGEARVTEEEAQAMADLGTQAEDASVDAGDDPGMPNADPLDWVTSAVRASTIAAPNEWVWQDVVETVLQESAGSLKDFCGAGSLEELLDSLGPEVEVATVYRQRQVRIGPAGWRRNLPAVSARERPDPRQLLKVAIEQVASLESLGLADVEVVAAQADALAADWPGHSKLDSSWVRDVVHQYPDHFSLTLAGQVRIARRRIALVRKVRTAPVPSATAASEADGPAEPAEVATALEPPSQFPAQSIDPNSTGIRATSVPDKEDAPADMDAVAALAIRLLKGDGMAQDTDQGLRLLQDCLRVGHPRAMVYMGWIAEQGLGVPRSLTEAVDWYRRAADAGDPKGMTNLGVMLTNGNGIARDDDTAMAWFRKAKALGHADALAAMGWMFEHGRGVTPNAGLAQTYYQLAAQKGSALAIKQLEALGIRPDHASW